MKTSGFKTELNGGRKDDLFEARQAFSSLSTIMTNKVTTITTDLLRNSLHLKVLFKLLFFFFFSTFKSNFLKVHYDLHLCSIAEG